MRVISGVAKDIVFQDIRLFSRETRGTPMERVGGRSDTVTPWEEAAHSAMLSPGKLVADRFEIEHRAGKGGMGVVFRARDRQTGQPVALKMLLAESNSQDIERFAREARLLAELHHPGVVTYVAHGRTEHDLFYLALEWLEGEDLGRRLEHQPLTMQESMTLVRTVAEALAAIHRHGVVHRDINPSNLFLRHGQIERVTLIDFGIARGGSVSWSVTRTGEVVGTLQYIAPEQARGEQEVKASADVFALGCVLYECLTGVPPFPGKNQAAVLVRVLLEKAPLLRHLRPDLPPSFDLLLERMLAKDPAARLADGEALVGALRGLDLPAPLLGAVPGPSSRAERLAEQQLVNLVLALPRPSVTHDTVTIRLTDQDPRIAARRAALMGALAPLGVRVDHLAEGAMLVALPRSDYAATDQAIQAAQVALLVRRHLPAMAVALTTGQGLQADGGTVEGALEAASQLILEMSDRFPADAPLPVLVDKRTAALIDARFDVRQMAETAFVLEGERTGVDEMRRLLGRPTPFVGRDQELQLLEMRFARCLEEGSAEVLLVVGPPGVGKSRLRYEFLRRLEVRGGVTVLHGRGELLRAGAAYGLLTDALARLCGMGKGMDLDQQRAQLAARVELHVPASESRRVVEFLGELCGLSFPDEDSPQLKAARQDSRVLRDQVAAAVLTFLHAECAAHPVVLVLEDLHWGDVATVHLVDVVLREWAGAPLLVLGLGRPEMRERFPWLCEKQSVQEIRLGGLNRRASERLTRTMLGEQVTEETVAKIVSRAQGHALFLEELIRAVAEGHEQLPETVLAMLQARFLRLDPEARRVLRAASIFGETFWRGGVKEILGLGQEEMLEHWLESLVRAELIVRQPGGRFAGEQQFAFRHALVREAAYGLLGEEDRRLGHRVAGTYLERVGERDALMLAEHYERGRERERAARAFAQAARQALVSNDLEGALRLVARGVACGARHELLGTLRSVQAWAELWLGNFAASYESARAALELLPTGSPDWVLVQGTAVTLSGFQAQRERLREHMGLLTAARLWPGTESAFMEPAVLAITFASILGLHEPAILFLARTRDVSEQLGGHDPRARGMLEQATLWHRLLAGDLWPYQAAAQRAAACFAEAGDRRWLGAAWTHAGVGLILLGEIEQGRLMCREALDLLIRIPEPVGHLATQALFAFALAETGGPRHRDEARRLAEEGIGAPLMPKFWGGMIRVALATLQADAGAWGEAEQVARQALRVFEEAPGAKPLGCALLGRILLAQGRLEEARAVVEDGLVQLGVQGGQGLHDTKLYLTAAEVRHALGQEETARAALRQAAHRLAACAAKISDPAARQRFLDHSREHARLRELSTPPRPE
jgi:tetratricopeptide (TPR) repeat protein